MLKESKEPPLFVSVPLNLEESGWLCHLLIGDKSFREAVIKGVGTELDKRTLTLYRKIANANDILMGKA